MRIIRFDAGDISSNRKITEIEIRIEGENVECFTTNEVNQDFYDVKIKLHTAELIAKLRLAVIQVLALIGITPYIAGLYQGNSDLRDFGFMLFAPLFLEAIALVVVGIAQISQNTYLEFPRSYFRMEN